MSEIQNGSEIKVSFYVGKLGDSLTGEISEQTKFHLGKIDSFDFKDAEEARWHLPDWAKSGEVRAVVKFWIEMTDDRDNDLHHHKSMALFPADNPSENVIFPITVMSIDRIPEIHALLLRLAKEKLGKVLNLFQKSS